MKTNDIILLFSALFCLLSCAEETAEIVPPDLETDNYKLAMEYNQELSSVSEGWITRYQLEEETDIYTVYMKFNPDHTVDILSDYPNLDYLQKQQQVNYSLTGFLATEISFDTYCVWHRMYDDFGGDYQFIITRQTDGNYTLQAKDKAVIKLYRLERATPEAMSQLQQNIIHQREKVSEQNKLKNISDLLINFADDNSTYFKNIHLDGSTPIDGAVEIQPEEKQLKIIYRNDEQQAVTLFSNYEITQAGITLKSPMTINGNRITSLNLKKSGTGNNIDITDAQGKTTGQIYVSHKPGVSPYPDIASNYLNMHLLCYMHLYNGKEFTKSYLYLTDKLPSLSSLQVYTKHYTGSYPSAWVIYDSKFSRYYVTLEPLNEYTLKYTYKSNNDANKYPYIKPLLDHISSPEGYVVLYSKKKYLSSDLGSIVLIDGRDSNNYIILRVVSNTDYNPASWASIDWSNVVYGD